MRQSATVAAVAIATSLSFALAAPNADAQNKGQKPSHKLISPEMDFDVDIDVDLPKVPETRRAHPLAKPQFIQNDLGHGEGFDGFDSSGKQDWDLG